jgi:hypothetical protein
MACWAILAAAGIYPAGPSRKDLSEILAAITAEPQTT